MSSIFITILILTSAGLLSAVAELFRVQSTRTSTRSFEGRILLWRNYSQLLRTHLWLGVGGFNAPLNKPTGSDRPFVSRAYNPILQVALHNGLFGLIIAFSFLSYSGKKLWLCVKDSQLPIWKRELGCIIFGGLLGVICGDFTSGSLVLYPPTMYVFLSLLAIGNHLRPDDVGEPRAAPCLRHNIVSSVALLGISYVLLPVAYDRIQADEHFSIAWKFVASKNYSGALREIEAAEGKLPDDPTLAGSDALIHLRIIEAELPSVDPETFLVFCGGLRPIAKLHLREALREYQRASLLSPRDLHWKDREEWLSVCLNPSEMRDKEPIEKDVLPDDYLTYFQRGFIAEQKGIEEQAVVNYAHAIVLYPPILSSRLFGGVSIRNQLLSEKSKNKALSMLSVGLKNDPIKEARLARYFWEESKDKEVALQLGSNAVRMLPTLSGAWYVLGKIQEARGAEESARDDYLRANFFDSGDPHNLLKLRKWLGTKIRIQVDWKILSWEPEDVHSTTLLRLYGRPPIERNDDFPKNLRRNLQEPIDLSEVCRDFIEESLKTGSTISNTTLIRFDALGHHCDQRNLINAPAAR